MQVYKNATPIIAGAFQALDGKALLRSNDKGSCIVEVETVNPDGTSELTEIRLSVGGVVEVSFTGVELISGAAVALS